MTDALGWILFIGVMVFLFHGDPDVMDGAIAWSRAQLAASAGCP